MLDDLLEDVKSDLKKEEIKVLGNSNDFLNKNKKNPYNIPIIDKLNENASIKTSILIENTTVLKQNFPNNNLIQKNEKVRCFPLFIGGSELTNGITENSFNPKSCSTLRCTNCDLTIKRYVGKKWIEGLNYLFFRNYITNNKMLESVT